VGPAVRLLLTSELLSSVGALARQQSIATPSLDLGIAHDNRSGNRRQGMPVASRREWYRDRADILDFTSTVNGSPESTVFVGGMWVLTEKRYSVRFARYLLRTPRPDSSTRSSVTPAQRKPMRPQRPRSLPTARATTARPRLAMLLGSAEGRPRVPIGRIVMAPRKCGGCGLRQVRVGGAFGTRVSPDIGQPFDDARVSLRLWS
jgi:hypothetical protein